MIIKILFSLLIFISFFANSVFAANQIPGSSVGGYSNVTDQGPIQHMQIVGQCDTNGTVDSAQCYTQFSLSALFNAGTYAITGNLLNENSNGGSLGAVNSFIATLYSNPAASSVDYVQNIANNTGFPNAIKPAYAAEGFGFRGLNFILPLWEAMRNIAYLLFAILFIIVGLMIVLRVKIDPKTVITIQSALPKIIWTLILITFSYPIAGLLIDLMYVTLGLMFSIVNLTGLYPGGVQTFAESLKTANFIDIMNNLGGKGAGAQKAIGDINTFTQSVIGQLFQAVNIQSSNKNFNKLITDYLSPLLGLFVSISIFVAMLKTFLNLLTSYGTIIFSIILSPIILLGEAIPGRSAFAGWLKQLIGNLLVFPLTIMMILWGTIILSFFVKSNITDTEKIFLPPLVGIPGGAIGALLGYIIIMTLPHAQDLLNEWLSIKVSKSTSYWQESIPFKGTAQKGIGNITGALTRFIPI